MRSPSRPHSTALVALVLLLVVSTVTAHAQDARDARQNETEQPPRAFQGPDNSRFPEFPAPPADLGEARLRMVFDLVSGAQELAVEPNQPFDVYIVAHNVYLAVQAWEAELLIDERFTVLERAIDATVNLGEGNEVRAALRPADCKFGSPAVLGRLKLMLTEPGQNDLTLGFGPVSNGSVPSVDTEIALPAPVYLVCSDDRELRAFDACTTCAVVNPATVKPERDASTRDPLRDLLKLESGR